MSKGFQFKQFYVAHDRCAMKVGTDGVLLGATAPIGGPRVLDIGTGTGLVSLMIAQRYFSSLPTAEISSLEGRSGGVFDAIDIVPEAVEQARENFANSPWAEQLHAYQSSLQDWQSQPYHLIVSNPPYFVDSLKNPDKGRETARHTDTLSYEDLIKHSKRLLAPDGVLQLILPIEAEQEIRRIAAAYELYPVRILYIHTTVKKAPKRFVIAFAAGYSQSPIEGHLTLMGEDGEPRSREYAELCKDYYL